MSMQRNGGSADRGANWPVIIWALYIASFITFGLTILIGAIMAYVKRRELARHAGQVAHDVGDPHIL